MLDPELKLLASLLDGLEEELVELTDGLLEDDGLDALDEDVLLEDVLDEDVLDDSDRDD